MVHKIESSKKDGIEWGFDLTDVKSDDAFTDLLNEFGFTSVIRKNPEPWMKGRFMHGKTTFANPSGIRFTVEHMGGIGSDKGALGYIGITAPKNAEPELLRFLAKFRGSKKVVGTDVMTKGGITTYVKQEDAYESGYISE